jgi:predicted enzyme related to lactoylglutathione lyase
VRDRRAERTERTEVTVMGGRVVHFEIPFDEGDRARAFYQDAFGWTVTSMPEMDYTVVTTGPTTEQGMPAEPGYINGGMVKRPQGSQGPVITIDVDDITVALAKIEQLGGHTVQPRQEVAQMGFAAYFTDSEGNLIGLWQNASSTS